MVRLGQKCANPVGARSTSLRGRSQVIASYQTNEEFARYRRT
jgi:hypothetical protein